MILLDTHAAIWLALDIPQLGTRSRAATAEAAAKNQLRISVISIWEIALLVQKRRLIPNVSAADLRQKLMEARVDEFPLTGSIALLSTELGQFHPDPADRFITATAIVHGATLMTADRRILRWRHPLARQDASK